MKLTRRVLNRTLLRRQFLLERTDSPALDVIRHLVAVQGQEANAPYVGLWCRVEAFRHDDLTSLLHGRDVVRSSVLRGTQHLIAGEDFGWVRALLQPTLNRASRAAFGRLTAGIDPEELAAAGRELLAGRTLTRSQLRDLLLERFPGRDGMALAWTAQGLVPVVHPPPNGTWNWGGATPFVLASEWLPGPSPHWTIDELVRRYLRAFGPATPADMRIWSGITGLREVFERMRGELRVDTDDAGRELFDVPDGVYADPDEPAPVRFVPMFDNLILSHADRTRVIDADAGRHVLLGSDVRATVLVDGFVAARWRLTRAGGVEIETFRKLTRRESAEVEREAGRLLDFAAGPDDSRRISVAAL